MKKKPFICLVAAMGEGRVIGNEGDIPWRIKGEQERFKNLAMGKTVIMGRETFDSLPGQLAGRRIIVLSRKFDSLNGVEVYKDRDAALNSVKELDESYIAGGEAIYRIFLPICDRIYLTTIHKKFKGDTFFPEFDMNEYKQTFCEKVDAVTPYTYLTYDRIWN